MNEFFKYLLPQLLAYFHGDKVIVDSFIPETIKEHYKNLLYELNDKIEKSDKK